MQKTEVNNLTLFLGKRSEGIMNKQTNKENFRPSRVLSDMYDLGLTSMMLLIYYAML